MTALEDAAPEQLALIERPKRCHVCGRFVADVDVHTGHRDGCQYAETGLCRCGLDLCPACCPCNQGVLP